MKTHQPPNYLTTKTETMKLISMTDFVLDCVTNAPIEEYHQVNETFVNKVVNYANFLNQPLKLEMFVPCDEIGEVMNYEEIKQSVIEGTDSWDAYEKAKEKVLFEGFEMHDNEVINDELERSFFIQDLEFFTIEELEIMSQKKPSLTPTAIKQIQP